MYKKLRNKILLLLTFAALITMIPSDIVLAAPNTSDVLIHEIYGGGGDVGTYYASDFIVLKNVSSDSISLDKWQIQQAPIGATYRNYINLSGTVETGKYYLIQLHTGTAGKVVPLPRTPDIKGNFNMSASAAKVRLVNNTGKIMDSIEFQTGTPETPGVLHSARRISNTGDNNVDFMRIKLGEGSLDYLIEEEIIAEEEMPIIVISEFPNAKVGVDYNFEIKILNGEEIYAATFKAIIGTTEFQGDLLKVEDSEVWKGSIPGNEIMNESEIELQFSVIDAVGNILSDVYLDPFEKGVSEAFTEKILITIERDTPIIIKDRIGPKITGVKPLQHYYQGDVVNLLKGVKAIDDVDGEVNVITIPSSIDTSEPGSIKVIYYARDRAGNVTRLESTMVILEKIIEEEKENYPEIDEKSIYSDNNLVNWTLFNFENNSASGWNYSFHKESDISSKWNNPFLDVNSNHWFYNDVQYAYENDLMRGMEFNKFEPNLEIQRGMFVEVLFNLAGRPIIKSGIDKFSDVSQDEYFANAIDWARSIGIIEGVDINKFDPYSSITREQLVTLIYRYGKHINMDIFGDEHINKFADREKISLWAIDAMNWAIDKEIINGMEDNSLNPQHIATRAEVGAIVGRFHRKIK